MDSTRFHNPSAHISGSIITGGTFYHQSTSIHSPAKTGYDKLLEVVASGALHNSGHVVDAPKCHPNTRVAVIDKILCWAALKDESTKHKLIMWLRGAAGAGKSAIGRSVAERSAASGNLLASFFFGASDPTRNHSRSLVATIAYQICAINPTVREVISTCIDSDPLIFTRTLKTQFSELVIKPLYTVISLQTGPSPRYLVIIDGLDECLDESSQCDILNTLLEVAKSSPIVLRFLICSRPENQISNAFNSIRMQEILTQISLDDTYHAGIDIEIYLRESFANIKGGHLFKASIPISWPTETIINDLVNKSSGQFIYAVTVIRYVESSRHRPHQRLDAVLGLRPPFKDLPFVQLDALYAHILSKVDNTALVLDILAFPALYHSYHITDIERILNLEPGEVEVLMSDLGSVVKIKRGHLFLLHKSLADFILNDKERSKDLFMDPVKTRIDHLVSITRIFSERSLGCRIYSTDSLCVFDVIGDLQFEDISSRDRHALVDAVTLFPMVDFCKSLFAHFVCACGECHFLSVFMKLLFRMQSTGLIDAEALNRHLHSYTQCVLLELLSTYNHDHEVHFQFYIRNWMPWIRKNLNLSFQNYWPRTYFISLIENALPTIIGVYPAAESTASYRAQFRAICARAATFCLAYLSNVRTSQKEMALLLRHRRRSGMKYSKMWGGQHSRRVLLKTPVIIWTTTSGMKKALKHCRLRDALQEYHHQRNIDIYLTLDVQRIGNSPSKVKANHLYTYGHMLWFLSHLLPFSERYNPLVMMCQKRALSFMSTAFPELSRRARRQVARYLERVEV